VTVTVGGDVLFATDSAVLRPEAVEGLERILPLLGEAQGAITVAGHTDNRGGSRYNRDLSYRRAETVASWLASRAGIPASRLRIVGKGSTLPVATNATATGRARNRRVIVTIERTAH
jgi:outer membrane protein OmpA-like peptidoglycan-associated protein